MKYALANGIRREAQPGISGECAGCGSSMVAKCGEVKIWHWSHKGTRTCDPWWENETEWHRSWKQHFPESWQEIVHTSDSGERHIADVKTEQGWVLEFQYSHIKPEERRSRNYFYQKIVWVVNGSRKKLAHKQFLKGLDEGHSIGTNPPIRAIYIGLCAPIKEWSGSSVPVFFDFGEDDRLWCLIPYELDDMYAYVVPFARTAFIELHRGDTKKMNPDFASCLTELVNAISNYKQRHRQSMEYESLRGLMSTRLSNFQRIAARRNRFRGRL